MWRGDLANILIVEDSEDLIALWRELFSRAGIRATFAKSGQEALAIVREGFVPGVLMTDYYLPDMTGTDLIGEIRKINPVVQALIVTGNSNSDFRFSLPSDTDFLTKPVRFEKLRQKLEELGLRRAPPALI